MKTNNSNRFNDGWATCSDWKIKELIDEKVQFVVWSKRDDIKNELNMQLTVLLYKNGYPPEWYEEVFEQVMEQAENFKKYSDL